MHEFVKARAEYKKTLRKAEKQARKNLTNLLMNIGKNNPTGFWNLINKMNKWENESSDPPNKIPPEKWKKHFQELLSENKENTTVSKI